MATGMYALGLEAFLNGDIDWASDNIKVAMITASVYTANLATDQFLDDIPGGGIIATSANLTGKSTTGGVADAADATFTSVGGPDDVDALVVYKDTGTPSTSPLICYIDNYTGLPATPNGSNISVIFPSDANKIFKL